jgi:cytoskeletal protein RodZ
MAKDKKKNAKKDKKQEDVLDNTARTLKKFRRVTKHLTKLTTGQKVVGGVALVAAGLVYLAKKQNEAGATANSTDAAAAEASLSSLISGPGEPEAAPTDGPSTAESSTPAPAAARKSKKRK